MDSMRSGEIEGGDMGPNGQRKYVPITLTVSESMRDEIDTIARIEDLDRSKVVRRALREFLKAVGGEDD